MRGSSGSRSTAFLISLATKSNDAGGRELRDGLILALARGARRSGGRLQAGCAATNPGARLLEGMIDETKTAVLDDRAPEAVRVCRDRSAGHA